MCAGEYRSGAPRVEGRGNLAYYGGKKKVDEAGDSFLFLLRVFSNFELTNVVQRAVTWACLCLFSVAIYRTNQRVHTKSGGPIQTNRPEMQEVVVDVEKLELDIGKLHHHPAKICVRIAQFSEISHLSNLVLIVPTTTPFFCST